MKKIVLGIIIMSCIVIDLSAQITTEKFGNGLRFEGKDSTFYLRFGFRFQNLYVNEWQINDGSLDNHESNFLIRRSRLKMDGWAYSPKLKYKLELGLTNRDIRSGADDPFGNTANIILDAYVQWKFYGNFSVLVGQTKLPGNRERVVSSANLQFVDRSRLNSRFNLDRDMGIHLIHEHKIGDNFYLVEKFVLSQGEGRNVIVGNYEGYGYTFWVEAYPFGKFQSKGAYVGSAIKREATPKLAVALSYDINDNAFRERGQLGSFIDETAEAKDLNTLTIDMMFKYQKVSVMAEFVDRKTDDDDPRIFAPNDVVVGEYYTGNALNIQAGYMFDSNWELAARYTDVNPDEFVASPEVQYTLGLSKFVVGHKLKVQADWTYRDIFEGTDSFIWRTQMDIHF